MFAVVAGVPECQVILVFGGKLEAVTVLKSAVVAGQIFCFDTELNVGGDVPETHDKHGFIVKFRGPEVPPKQVFAGS